MCSVSTCFVILSLKYYSYSAWCLSNGICRFESGLGIQFMSQTFNLVVDVDINLVDVIMTKKASTKTMNLFFLWVSLYFRSMSMKECHHYCSHFLNITWMLLNHRWLEYTLTKEAVENVWFVDSLWFPFLKSAGLHEDSKKVQNYFGSVDVSKHLFVFLPIVDRYG